MLGAIIGDIVGSRFEFSNTFRTDFKLFAIGSNYTDDTICTIAVADAILKGIPFAESLQKWCRKYPNPQGSYGAAFHQWVLTDNPKPYYSYGNGSAMRVSPCAWVGNDLNEVLELAAKSAECTHNHPEGIKGAVAVADCIFHVKSGFSKSELKNRISDIYGYNLDQTCNEIRVTNSFNETCQISVPQAIRCYLESDGFENAVRLAVSIGGDSDTIAAITGSIAEADKSYCIPGIMLDAVNRFLTTEMINVIHEFYHRYRL
ncbi:MAG: ADP-ribosylglycohydrolase family protein [Bacteroidales bacterium]|nr:ADP-ribosylglycohydrolase family protein [Bacteroidales bacterium]MDD3989882.1 ADP-ribosylglycohydrolase family protein [Bacteroidales bacterium]MDD4638297.1 ADP-ribosylglycohydrolase family protein [Bacteroidales bacterium]